MLVAERGTVTCPLASGWYRQPPWARCTTAAAATKSAIDRHFMAVSACSGVQRRFVYKHTREHVARLGPRRQVGQSDRAVTSRHAVECVCGGGGFDRVTVTAQAPRRRCSTHHVHLDPLQVGMMVARPGWRCMDDAMGRRVGNGHWVSENQLRGETAMLQAGTVHGWNRPLARFPWPVLLSDRREGWQHGRKWPMTDRGTVARRSQDRRPAPGPTARRPRGAHHSDHTGDP